MKGDRKPLRIRGTYVGTFDAISCPICMYHYFPEEVYDQALTQSISLGLVGPPIPEHSFVPTIEEFKVFFFQRFDLSTNQSKVPDERRKIVGLPVSNQSGFSAPAQKRIVEAPVAVTLPEHSG